MPRTSAHPLHLRGQVVAFTGRLAALTRARAEALVRGQGGTPVGPVSDATTLLVVGADGWPLRKDGRLTKNLLRARLLARLGHPVETVEEDTFLRRLGQPDAALHPYHSLSEVVCLLEVSGEWVRTWVRNGLLKPHLLRNDVPYFTFAQVARMRSLCKLLRAGVSATRLKKSLRQLLAWLPNAEELAASLTQLEGMADLSVRLEDGRLLDLTGQLRFDFEPVHNHVLSFAAPIPAKDAATWFAEGAQLEESGHLDGAANAYRQALLLGGPTADACFNLANVLARLGQVDQASERFRQVLELHPKHADAWNNLGNLLADLGKTDGALEAYRQAVASAPERTEARYNLADLLDRLGRKQEAHGEWKQFLRQEAYGPWADYARRRVSS